MPGAVSRLPEEVEQGHGAWKAAGKPEGVLDQLRRVQEHQLRRVQEHQLRRVQELEFLLSGQEGVPGAKPWASAALVQNLLGISRREGGHLGIQMLRALGLGGDDAGSPLREQIQVCGPPAAQPDRALGLELHGFEIADGQATADRGSP